MTLRPPRERLYQTLAYEAGGLLLATPLYALAFGTAAEDSFVVIAALSVAVMLFSPVHNWLFDLLEWRLAARVASDRPHGLRLIHAISHEATMFVVTLPLLMIVGHLTFVEAAFADLGLTAVYSAYAYVFHWVWDWLRPVRQSGHGMIATSEAK